MQSDQKSKFFRFLVEFLFQVLSLCLGYKEIRAIRSQYELSPSQFVSKYVSLIVLKLQFLRANFEEIYQKHVSRPAGKPCPPQAIKYLGPILRGGQTANR